MSFDHAGVDHLSCDPDTSNFIVITVYASVCLYASDSQMCSMMMYTPPISMSAAAALWMGVGGGIMLCGRDEDAQERKHKHEDAEAYEMGMCVIKDCDVPVPVDASDGQEEAHRHRMEGEARWDLGWESPEAWLVQSDSIDEASNAAV